LYGASKAWWYTLAMDSKQNFLLFELIWLMVSLVQTVFLIAALLFIFPEARAFHRLFTLTIVVFPIAYISTFLARVLNLLLLK
jgi:hypothetical protein